MQLYVADIQKCNGNQSVEGPGGGGGVGWGGVD